MVLASRLPWQQIEASISHLVSHRARAGDGLPELDLLGEQITQAPKAGNAGRPHVLGRTMIALLYLKQSLIWATRAWSSAGPVIPPIAWPRHIAGLCASAPFIAGTLSVR